MLGASILQGRTRFAQGYEVGPKARRQDHLPAPSMAPAKSRATHWSQRRVVFTLRVMAVVGTMQESTGFHDEGTRSIHCGKRPDKAAAALPSPVQILENTPENHPDHSHLKHALEKAEELCSQVNEGVREKENSDRLEWIQAHVQCEGLSEVGTCGAGRGGAGWDRAGGIWTTLS